MSGIRFVTMVAVLGLGAGISSATTACGGSSSKVALKIASNQKLKESIVVDAGGKTLYMFTAETNGTVRCVDNASFHCVKIWPPLTAKGKLRGGNGIDDSLLGMTKRPGGQVQVTYNKHPLYYFNGYGSTPADKTPGDVNGQLFGGVWYVLSPKGAPITHQ